MIFVRGKTMASITEFTRNYARAVSEGYAAVFAGAGLSRASGYLDWKELVRPLAQDIGLDVEKEKDLIAIAQYFVNEKRSRSAVEQRIINEFSRKAKENENINVLTRLPISAYWTTNYDELLEIGLKANNRKADIKSTQESLAVNIYDRDAVVYKMHGDVRNPKDAVLTKDDYESYELGRSLFRTALQGELVTKTFLFIGFSFNDPNLNYVLSQIRSLLGESIRNHYFFIKKIDANDFTSDKDYQYEVSRHRLQIQDLLRYGIQAVELDSYEQITEILNDVERKFLSSSIFISGSVSKPPDYWNGTEIDSFVYNFAVRLIKNDFKITSGFGFGIGSLVVNGALDEIMSTKFMHVDEYLRLRPFPQNTIEESQRKLLWRKYREDMISQAGIVLFLFGNKEVNGCIVNADGMMEEYEIAKMYNKLILPVGCTGGSSKAIFSDMLKNKSCYKYLEPYWEALIQKTDQNTLSDMLFVILENMRNWQ